MVKKTLVVAIAAVSLSASAQTSNGTYIQTGAFGGLIDPGINPLRPVGDYVEIQEMINTASYINTQVSNAQASVIEMSMNTPLNASLANDAVVPVAVNVGAVRFE